MDVRQSVFVLANGVVPDTSSAVVDPGGAAKVVATGTVDENLVEIASCGTSAVAVVAVASSGTKVVGDDNNDESSVLRMLLNVVTLKLIAVVVVVVVAVVEVIVVVFNVADVKLVVAVVDVVVMVLAAAAVSASSVDIANTVVTSTGYEPSCIVHWVFGIHLVTTSGPCCTVQQTPGGSALVQSLRPSMEVTQSAFVLRKKVVSDTASAVVTTAESMAIVFVRSDKAAVVAVTCVSAVGVASIVVISAGYEPSCIAH